MKEKLVSIGTLVCLVVLTCLLAVYALAIFPGVPSIRWFFASTAAVGSRLDAAAWVQAIGSILAIWAAIGIAWWQRWAEQGAARRSAYERAVLNASRVFMTLGATGTSLRRLAELLPEVPLADDPRRQLKLVGTLFESIRLPSEEQILSMVPLPGDIARTLIRISVHVEQGRHFLASATAVPNAASLLAMGEWYRNFGHLIGIAADLVVRCERSISEVLASEYP